jgi:aspartyl-tRNA(Asn)/glutamyl-tRNA(Gln) amidotransferase subunit C
VPDTGPPGPPTTAESPTSSDGSVLRREDVAHLAQLARIELSEQELDQLAPQLELILKSVAQVSEVARPDVAPTSHPVPITNVFRDDQVVPGLTSEQALAAAPAVEDQRFRVPRILEEEA